MTKKVVAILPHGKTDFLDVTADLRSVEFLSDKGGRLSLPIETFVMEGKEFLIARYDSAINDEITITAIKKYYP